MKKRTKGTIVQIIWFFILLSVVFRGLAVAFVLLAIIALFSACREP
jgi:hypothetical protein